ncbi:nucleosome assembly protein 1-like 1-B [Daphnia carinata]|uniref:nucleosome assembly protein 1-like 1-B n=1 Tax=Daphnia carinata TaxID=120202 RepID=UPI00257F563E|nr:nucleosome assembly protein 1-like 1-B [Daphnia carinata]
MDSDKAAIVENSEEDIEEVEEEEEGSDKLSKEKLQAAVLQNPKVMAALQARLDSMVGDPSGYIKSLPAAVQRRIKALKNLQLETTKIEAEFFKEVHVLECKYQEKYQSFFEKRAKITSGDYEPTDEECVWTLDDDKESEELSEDMKNKVTLENDTKEEDMKGVPEFWLTIFKNVELLADMVQDHDEPILKHLVDIKVRYVEEPMGFILDFHFTPNDYFENTILTKTYDMKCVPDEEDPFSFEGPEIHKCKGTTIDWKKGKNVTVKTIKKKQKHKSKGSVRTVSKTVQNDSFFNFFSPPAVTDDADEEVDEDTRALLTADFEIGHYIRESIVPRATLYFTGDALMEDDFDEEEEEEEGDEEGEEGEEEDEDPDFDPRKHAKAVRGQKGQANPAECKQQ